MQMQQYQLINNLSEIFKSFHQRSYHKMDDKCLYPGQPKLLGLINKHEGITQKDLAEKTFVTPATITGMLSKLEANNYVYRIPDETDKRIMRVYLTPEGRHLAEQAEEFLKKLTLQLFEGFTEEELQNLIHMTDKIKENLHKTLK
jgi:DNA-binding MarR family transcriptional regulator